MAKSRKMKLPIQEVLGVVGGAVAAGFVKNLVEKQLPAVPGTIKALIPVGAGIFLAGNKNVILRGVGYGMVAKGGSDLAAALLPGTITGVDDIFLSEPADQSILSLPADQSVMAGFEDTYLGATDEFIGEEFIGEEFIGEEFIGEDALNGEDSMMMGASELDF